MKLTGSAKIKHPSHQITIEMTQEERDKLVVTFNDWEKKFRSGGDYVNGHYVQKDEVLANFMKEVLLGLV